MRMRRWVGAIHRTPSERRKIEDQGGGDPLDIVGVRARVNAVMESRWVVNFITSVIILNAITLGLDTSASIDARYGPLLDIIDDVILGIFIVELGLKLFGQGLRFFKNGWNLFDSFVVGIALVPAAGPFSVLRALRVLRVLRLVTVVPAMRKVVAALFASIPGVMSIVALLGLVFYVFGVISTKLYGAAFPQWFGTIGESMYSLFQIMTLESWSMGIVRPVMEKFPQAWLVFVPFILLTSFAVLNLFIAVIVNAMQDQHAAEMSKNQAEIRDASQHETEILLAEIRSLRDEVRDVRERIRDRERGG